MRFSQKNTIIDVSTQKYKCIMTPSIINAYEPNKYNPKRCGMAYPSTTAPSIVIKTTIINLMKPKSTRKHEPSYVFIRACTMSIFVVVNKKVIVGVKQLRISE